MKRSIATLFSAALITGTYVAAQSPSSSRVPRLWTDDALRAWALPIAGVKTTPNFYTEAEYYAAPIDELRTYPVYRKGRAPKGYREWILAQGPRPLVEPQKLETEADWIAAGRDVFDGMDLGENRTDDPRAFAWIDDSELQARERVPVTNDGIIPDVRFVVDHDGRLKVTLGECTACHLRALPDGSLIRGAQGNLPLTISLAAINFEHADQVRKREGTLSAPNEASYAAFAVPWLKDDINASLKTMPKEELERVVGEPTVAGTFTRFNGSPWFTNRTADLIGV